MPTMKKKAYGVKKEPQQEIVTLAHNVSAAIQARRKAINITVAALAAVFIVLAGYALIKSLNEQKAAPLLEAAYREYKAPVPDYAKSLELFRAVQKKYPSSLSGAIALFYAGNCLMDMGRNEEALKEYQSFAGRYTGDSFLLGLVYSRMGYLSLSMGRRDEAIAAFERADSLAGPGVATVELARLYEAAGNSAESQKKYKIVADQLAGSGWAREAMGKIQQIQAAPVPDQKK